MKILLFLLLIPFVHGLSFSEIMFNPHGSDNGKEFVELLGNENLTDCTVTDSKSSDSLELLAHGSDVVLIVESDGNFTVDGVSIYSAGKAIGNGLGNSFDELTITCNGTVLANTSYNTSEFEYEVGHSIVFDNGWTLGPENGTPGVVETEGPKQESKNLSENTTQSELRGGEQDTFCNTTLAITVSETNGDVGDVVRFSVVADGVATFDVEANNEVFLEGDTLTLNEYSFPLPETTKVKIAAKARQCDAKQRAARYIGVTKKNVTRVEEIPENETIVNSSNVTVLKQAVKENVTTPVATPIVTANVVYDTDTNIIPWISGFGIVTLLVSAALFFHLARSDDE